MAATVVKTAAATNTQMSNTTENPSKTANRSIYYITLVAEGVTVTPAQIYSALDTQFGTVAAETAQVRRGCYIFNVSS